MTLDSDGCLNNEFDLNSMFIECENLMFGNKLFYENCQFNVTNPQPVIIRRNLFSKSTDYFNTEHLLLTIKDYVDVMDDKKDFSEINDNFSTVYITQPVYNYRKGNTYEFQNCRFVFNLVDDKRKQNLTRKVGSGGNVEIYTVFCIYFFLFLKIS